MLLTAYSDDTRVPLAGVLKYTEQLKKAIHTHLTIKPKSGTHTLSHLPALVDNVDAYVCSHACYCINMCLSTSFSGCVCKCVCIPAWIFHLHCILLGVISALSGVLIVRVNSQ